MANSSYPFNYFPLVSGSGGQDSLDSFNYFPLVSGSTTNLVFKKHHPHGKFAYPFNSCSKKIHHPHGKIRVHLCNLWEINLSVGENTHPRAQILQKKCHVLNTGSLSASAG